MKFMESIGKRARSESQEPGADGGEVISFSEARDKRKNKIMQELYEIGQDFAEQEFSEVMDRAGKRDKRIYDVQKNLMLLRHHFMQMALKYAGISGEEWGGFVSGKKGGKHLDREVDMMDEETATHSGRGGLEIVSQDSSREQRKEEIMREVYEMGEDFGEQESGEVMNIARASDSRILDVQDNLVHLRHRLTQKALEYAGISKAEWRDFVSPKEKGKHTEG